MPLSEIRVTNAPGQEFSTFVAGQKVTIRLRYNTSSERFSMDIAIDEQPALTGRKVTTNVDLIAPFDFGIGSIFAAGVEDMSLPATLENMASGDVKLFHYIAD